VCRIPVFARDGFLSVPPPVCLLPFTSGATFGSEAFTAITPGPLTITAAAFGSSRTASVEVVAGPSTLSISAFPPPVVGQTSSIQFFVDCVVAANTTITLSQTNPAALSLPATAVIPTGASFVAVDVTGLAAAATTITATLEALTDTETITPLP